MQPKPGRYRFRPVTPDDFDLLYRWRNQPQVREWWGDPEPHEAADLADPRVAVMIVECDGTPFAYMQDYDVHGWDGHHFGYLPEGSRGIDQFIGEPTMIGLGHGTAFIRQRVEALFAAGVPVIGTDPHPTNARAIAAYEKAGFRIVGSEQDTEWGRVIRLEAWRHPGVSDLGVSMAVIRRALPGDIDDLIRIRAAVQENRLLDPASVTRADYSWFVAGGRVWLAEIAGRVAGFSAGDARDGTIWALFVDPQCEGAGLGAKLLAKACDDLRADGFDRISLSTDPGTKAARLYRNLGWQEAGLTEDGEIKFVIGLAAE